MVWVVGCSAVPGRCSKCLGYGRPVGVGERDREWDLTCSRGGDVLYMGSGKIGRWEGVTMGVGFRGCLGFGAPCGGRGWKGFGDMLKGDDGGSLREKYEVM